MSESNQPSASSSTSEKTERTSDKSTQREPHSYDPELDIRSKHFNPLKALYAPSIPLPTENVPVYNNLAHFESTMKMRQEKQQQQATGDSSVSKSTETEQ